MRLRTRGIGFLGLGLVLFACTPPPLPPPPSPPGEPGVVGRLLVCNRGTGTSASKTFMVNRTDSLELNGHKLVIPAGALSAPTKFTMRELPTRIIKLRLHAGEKEQFSFARGKPATLVLNYRTRCANADEIAKGSASVYPLKSDDSEDVVPLDSVPLPSTHYRDQREVRASLSRLSGYGLGMP